MKAKPLGRLERRETATREKVLPVSDHVLLEELWHGPWDFLSGDSGQTREGQVESKRT